MNISNLIQVLQQIQLERGDCGVVFYFDTIEWDIGKIDYVESDTLRRAVLSEYGISEEADLQVNYYDVPLQFGGV